MAMAIDSTTHHEFDFLGDTASTTTTTSSTTTFTDQDQYACDNWDDWSPLVDWEALSGQPDDFQGLIESMIDDGGLSAPHHNQHLEQEPCYSTSSPGDESNMLADDQEDTRGSAGEDTKGLRLVHLLMAAAEALTGMNKSRELARVILVRLKELVSPNDGTTMERLASYFTDALQSLLEFDTSPNSHHSKHFTTSGPHHQKDQDPNHHQNDVLAAFQLLQDMSPYIKFGHFTANQAILEAVSQDRRIHIVDYDIMEGIQWASLMQALVSRKDGPPAPHLRITALSRPSSKNHRKSIAKVQETGRRLTAFAASIALPFSFHQLRLDSDESFRPSSLKLVRGEALIMNCMLHLPHFSYNRSSDSVASFLSGSKTLNPRLVTLVEEDATGRTTVGEVGFVERFMDSLHHYSAVCDSLEAGFPMQGRARALVERVFLGPQIAVSLARANAAATSFGGGREEVGCSWCEWLGRAGFRPAEISFANHCQARLLLGLFNDGYRVEELGSNRLVLGWKSRRLVSASVWTSPATSDSEL